MNPRVSHALVGAVAFVLGAAAIHAVTLKRMAALERQVLAEAKALAERRPVDLAAIDAFLAQRQARRAIESAALQHDAEIWVLAAIEFEARTVIDIHHGIYDHERFIALTALLRGEALRDHQRAASVLLMIEADRAHGITECYEAAGGRNPLAVDAECIYQDPERRDEARRALAEMEKR